MPGGTHRRHNVTPSAERGQRVRTDKSAGAGQEDPHATNARGTAEPLIVRMMIAATGSLRRGRGDLGHLNPGRGEVASASVAGSDHHQQVADEASIVVVVAAGLHQRALELPGTLVGADRAPEPKPSIRIVAIVG